MTSYVVYLFAGDILEVGVHCSIAMHDIPSFERHMAQLKCYYLNCKESKLYDNSINNIK